MFRHFCHLYKSFGVKGLIVHWLVILQNNKRCTAQVLKIANGHVSVEMNLPNDTVFLNKQHQTSDTKLLISVQMNVMYLDTYDEGMAVPWGWPLPEVLARSELCRITNGLTRKSN
jgi:hypothetical protein